MGDRLSALGCPIDVAPILDAAACGKSVGRPQIAAALLAAGHVQTRDEAFDRFLEFGGAAYVPRVGTSPEQVVAIIHEAGGIASLAHPGVNARDHLIAPLAAAGLDAIEAVHSDHDAATEARYRALAAELGLLVSGGSDFHGAPGASCLAAGDGHAPARGLRGFGRRRRGACGSSRGVSLRSLSFEQENRSSGEILFQELLTSCPPVNVRHSL